MPAKRKAVKKKPSTFQLPEHEPIMVCVWGHKITKQLAVTPSFTNVGQWALTHTPTGHNICDDKEFPTRAKAAKAAQEIDRLDIDWSRMKARDQEHNMKVAGEGNYTKLEAIIKRYAK